MKFKDFLQILFEADEKEEKPAEDEDKKEEKPAEDEEDKKSLEDETDDAEENFEPEQEESEQDKTQEAIDAKFDEMGEKVMVNIKDLLDKNASTIIQKFQKLGVDEAVREYLEQRFIPELDDDKDKMFLSLNIDDFLPIVAQKISVEYLKTGEE